MSIWTGCISLQEPFPSKRHTSGVSPTWLELDSCQGIEIAARGSSMGASASSGYDIFRAAWEIGRSKISGETSAPACTGGHNFRYRASHSIQGPDVQGTLHQRLACSRHSGMSAVPLELARKFALTARRTG